MSGSKRRSGRFADPVLGQSPPSSPSNMAGETQQTSSKNRSPGTSGSSRNRSSATTSRTSTRGSGSHRSRRSHVGLTSGARETNIVMEPTNGSSSSCFGFCARGSCCFWMWSVFAYFILLAVLLHNTMITNEKYDQFRSLLSYFEKVKQDNVYLGTRCVELEHELRNCSNTTLLTQDALLSCKKYVDLNCPLSDPNPSDSDTTAPEASQVRSAAEAPEAGGRMDELGGGVGNERVDSVEMGVDGGVNGIGAGSNGVGSDRQDENRIASARDQALEQLN